MTNSLVFASPAAAFLAAVLSAAPAFAQQPAPPEAAPTTPAAEAAPQSETVSAGVRIVRLSQVNGEVELDRKTGNGFEGAFANLPIVQGSRLRTLNGVAEVEFEDNSSLRLTPNSMVEFPVLSLNSSGVRTSTVHVVQGTVYASLTKSKDSNVSLTFGKETVALGPSAHVELALNGKQPRLDVLDGTAQAMNGATTTEVGKKKALLFDPAGATAPTLISKNEKSPYDAWDKQETEYHNRLVPTSSSYAGTPYTYGLADMNYYGSFVPMGGCGTMWQPYLVSSGWSPFSNGAWAWYPGAGYSWVSPYPWGWTAFHSGSWNYCPGAGWGWMPNNSWNGLQNVAAVTTPKQPGKLLEMKPPISKPRPVGPTMVMVNQKPLVFSKLNQDSFTFRRDSAGLGVPRNTFGNLNHISSDVVQHGSADRPVYIPSQGNGAAQGNHGMSAATPGNMSAHTTPSAAHSTYSSGSSSMGGGAHTMSSPSMGGGATSAGTASGGGHHCGFLGR